MGKSAPFAARTAQSTHSERFKSPKTPKSAKSPKSRRAPPDYLTTKEKDALFAVIVEPRDRAIFRLAFHHALRASELGLLEIKDYSRGKSLDADLLDIHRLKGSIGGETRLVRAAATALRTWLRDRGEEPGPIFLSRVHRPISRRRLDELMKHYGELAGIPPRKRHFHALKHTCGTLLLSERRESLVDVQHQMGHADIRSTTLYARLTDARDVERTRRLQDWR